MSPPHSPPQKNGEKTKENNTQKTIHAFNVGEGSLAPHFQPKRSTKRRKQMRKRQGRKLPFNQGFPSSLLTIAGEEETGREFYKTNIVRVVETSSMLPHDGDLTVGEWAVRCPLYHPLRPFIVSQGFGSHLYLNSSPPIV